MEGSARVGRRDESIEAPMPIAARFDDPDWDPEFQFQL